MNSLVSERARYQLLVKSTSVFKGMSGKTVIVSLTLLRRRMRCKSPTEGLRGMEAHLRCRTLPFFLVGPAKPSHQDGTEVRRVTKLRWHAEVCGSELVEPIPCFLGQ